MSGTSTDMVYQRGEIVALNSATGPISRVVVRDLGSIVEVCREEEYEESERLMREPIRVGFKKRDIIKRLR